MMLVLVLVRGLEGLVLVLVGLVLGLEGLVLVLVGLVLGLECLVLVNITGSRRGLKQEQGGRPPLTLATG